MAVTINVPQVGQDIETAVITEWQVKEGDAVKKGDVIALVESDKAVFEVECLQDGIVLKRMYNEGDEARVLEPLAIIGQEGETLAESLPHKAEKQISTAEAINQKKLPSFAPGNPSRHPKASPSARRLAREHNIDLNALTGSGPHGRIIKSDILNAAAKKTTQSAPTAAAPEPVPATATPVVEPTSADTAVPFNKIRQTIADRLTAAARDIPHFYLFQDVDMTAALAWRQAFNERSETKISVNDLIVRATARALKEFPRLNAHVSAVQIILKKDINIGIAVSTEQGLVVPVLENADELDIENISKKSRALAETARKGIMKPTAAGTFSISNLGMYGVSKFLPIINPPEAAILSVGGIEEKIVPLPGNSMGPRKIIALGLACDHRAVDGADAAKFLASLRTQLEQ